jgi:hypothetical protein
MNWVEDFEKFSKGGWSLTTLPKDEEKKFEKWFMDTKLFKEVKQEIATENNLPIQAIDNSRILEMLLSSKDYDYRAAWKAGIKEEVSPYDNKIHWPSSAPDGSLLKSPNHPTTWKEFFMRQYKVDPDELGLRTIEDAKAWQSEQSPRMKKRPLLRGR